MKITKVGSVYILFFLEFRIRLSALLFLAELGRDKPT